MSPFEGIGCGDRHVSPYQSGPASFSQRIPLDGFEPSHAALRWMGVRNEFNWCGPNPVKIRSCKYLNNIVEQDHRRVKFRVLAMLGFKSMQHARAVIAGIELIQKLKKGQYGVPFSFGSTSREIWRHVLAA